MHPKTQEILSKAPEYQIISSRVVNFPAAIVFRAWIDPQHLQAWWGPAGFTNTFFEFDPRPGGKWKFTMHGPDKGNYPNECEFIEIDPPRLIAWERISKPLFKVVTSFEEVDAGQTKITFRQIFDSEAECNKIRKFVVDKNEENFDRLEVELVKMIS